VTHLTDTELEILSATAKGKTSRDIAAETGRALSTVKSMKSRLVKKCGVKNINEAVFKSVHEIAAWRDGQPRHNGQED